MRNMFLKKILQNKYFILVIFAFLVIFLSRFLFLGADLASNIEIEGSPGGFNARNKVLQGHWPLYMNWYQPMVYVPVQNFVTFLSFRFLGVGITQLRFPCALASFVGLIFFYLILLKQTNRFLALLGLLLYAFNFYITNWSRSSLAENFYLLFMPVAIYFIIKDRLSGKDVFALVFFAGMNVVAKIDSYPFFLATITFLFFRSFKTNNFTNIIKPVIFGSFASLAVLLFLFSFSNSFKYVIPMYSFYRDLLVSTTPLISRLIPSFRELVIVLLRFDPYFLIAFLSSFPILIMGYRRFNRTDWFMVIFFFITLMTRLVIPPAYVSWKRIMYLVFPMVYFIFRSVYFLWQRKDNSKNNFISVNPTVIVLSMFSTLIPITIFLLFTSRFKEFLLSEAYFYPGLIILAIGIFNFIFIFRNGKSISTIIFGLIGFFVVISLVINSLKVAASFFSENIEYSYRDNEKFAQMIPEDEIIVGHEQAFRAFVYLSKHTFLYNHDGGPNPEVYREIIERKDLRYFILNINDFEGGLWGIPNTIKMQLIKDVYPNVKLMGVMSAMKINLAIYDKYGTE